MSSAQTGPTSSAARQHMDDAKRAAQADETGEWLDALDEVVLADGSIRGTELLDALSAHAAASGIATTIARTTPYANTIALAEQGTYPGDLLVEKRLRALSRWNAMAMVVRANVANPGIGGHLATYAPSASLLECGFNHFFTGRAGPGPADQVFFQGHAAPGVYARAFLEGRLTEGDLDGFRAEASGGGLPSYPHPRSLPEFWEFSTVSMGLGPLAAVHQARVNRYLEAQGLVASTATVWCFVGDGEMDEPEATAALSMAARERLSNLIFVVNCNLQRLDGPVRGNAKVIQEFEGLYSGAGWNVIKVVWGAGWDPLLAADAAGDGALLAKLTSTVDGEFQRLSTLSGAEVREQFFGTDPRLAALVAHLTDRDLELLPRGGHDSTKIAAAYQAAEDEPDRPSVILAKTVKGWSLGGALEGRNATHQMKKLTAEGLISLAHRLGLEDLVSDDELQSGVPPYLAVPPGSPEEHYLAEHTSARGGPVPCRPARADLPAIDVTSTPSPVFVELEAGSQGAAVSTTAAFVRALRGLMRHERYGTHVVPIVSDEARTFGMEPLISEMAIYDPAGMLYEAVDATMQLSYKESATGRILEEGISEAGALASFIALATSYATHGVPMLPIFSFYSMFGFQRVGDAIWQATDMRARGILAGCTAGRTTLEGEGLQHADGHSLVLASTNPAVKAYDPSFAYELSVVVAAALADALGSPADDRITYLALYNEPWVQPAMADGDAAHCRADILAGLHCLRQTNATTSDQPFVSLISSGPMFAAADLAAEILSERYAVASDRWSATSFAELHRDALATKRTNRLHPSAPKRTSHISACLGTTRAPVIAISDHVASLGALALSHVDRPATTLGTDGFGLSDTRENQRRHFEVTADHLVLAALTALVDEGSLDQDILTAAVTDLDIDPDAPAPFLL